jgi:hypothetical protein
MLWLLFFLEEIIYVKDDKDIPWEIQKALITNFIQTLFLVLFSVMAWFVRKFIMKMCNCDKKKEKEDEGMFQV